MAQHLPDTKERQARVRARAWRSDQWEISATCWQWWNVADKARCLVVVSAQSKDTGSERNWTVQPHRERTDRAAQRLGNGIAEHQIRHRRIGAYSVGWGLTRGSAG